MFPSMYWPLVGGFIAFVLLAVLMGWIMDTDRHGGSTATVTERDALTSGRPECRTLLECRSLVNGRISGQ